MTGSQTVLEWSDLGVSFGRKKLFSGLSGALDFGRTLVVRGRNGSGKTTLLRLFAGLSAPDHGRVERVGGASLGYCAPALSLYGELTGEENLAFFRKSCSGHTVSGDDLLATVGLSLARHKPVSLYSSGMQQRLKLAFSLLQTPRLLILDEPTLALDEDGVKMVDTILEAHRRRGGSAVIATNDDREREKWGDSQLFLS